MEILLVLYCQVPLNVDGYTQHLDHIQFILKIVYKQKKIKIKNKSLLAV